MQRALLAGIVSLALTTIGFADQPVIVTGCVETGVEAGCLVLRTTTGKIYNITAAKPAPAPGTYGTVRGTLKSGGMSMCQQGEVIDPAAWTMTAKSCPRSSRLR